MMILLSADKRSDTIMVELLILLVCLALILATHFIAAVVIKIVTKSKKSILEIMNEI